MKIVGARTEIVRWQIAGNGAARGRTERAAVLLEVVTESGHIGIGEAAPLPGFSGDSLEDAHADLVRFCAAVPFEAPLFPSNDREPLFNDKSRSAQFAIETALIDSHTRAAGIPFAAFFETDDSRTGVVHCAVVVDTPAQARRAVLDGARTLKIKAGPNGDIERILAIHRAAPDLTLRIDPNRTWAHDRALGYMRAIAELPIEYIEEPCADSLALLEYDLPLPIALDETLEQRPSPSDVFAVVPRALEDAFRSPHVSTLVIKPTVVGGFAWARAIAHFGRFHGKRVVVTHALEGPIGTAACAALAMELNERNVAAGLAPHPALAGWPVTIPYLDATKVHPNLEPGLGLERSRPLTTRLDASPRLSDLTAHFARENERAHVGNDLAVITPSRSVRFDELTAAETHRAQTSRAHAVLATPTLDTIRVIYAALAAHTPIALLHPRPPADELARQEHLVTTTDVPAGTAVVLFTSGSTGQARGVVLSRDALDAAASIAKTHLELRSDDRWLLALPLAHAGGLSIVVRARAARIPVVLLEGDFDRATCAALLEQCTLASLVPTQLAALLDDPAWRPPAKLRAVLLGGAAAAPALLEKAALRGVPFLLTYGLTETFGQIETAPLGHAGDPVAPLRLLPGVNVSAGSRAAPAMITVQSPTLATQYLDGAPIGPVFVTADIGFVQDGTLHVIGRADDVIITGGENVHPLAVEAVLAGTPGVAAAVVFGAADERWGQKVCAAIVVDASFDREKAAVAWRAGLAGFAVPKELAIVSTLPLLPNGKVDRRAAAQLPREPLRPA